jgi:hypothetical protein
MWLMAVSLTLLGGLSILGFKFRGWRVERPVDLGWMSQRWLAEHRASSY